RSLILYKLLRAQLPVLLSALFWTALAGSNPALPFALRTISFWVLFSTLYLHQLGATLVRTSAAEQGGAGVRRNALSIAVFAAAAVALLYSVSLIVPAHRGAPWLETAGAVLRHPAAAAVIFPFRIMLEPGRAPDVAAWARALLPAFGLLLAHYVWVLRTDTAFEEAAVEASARRAKVIAAVRERRPMTSGRPRTRIPRAWLPLPAAGRPEVAVVWKNLVAITRTFRLATAIRLLVGAGIGFVFASFNVEGSITEFLGVFVGGWAGLMAIAGPLWVRNDLRQDLPKLELLRTYPLSGATMVGAQVASAAFTLTVVQLLFLTLAYFLLLGNADAVEALSRRTAYLAGAGIVLPALNALSLCIQNAIALLFPDWGKRGTGGPGGIEVIGQSMFAMLGSLLVLAILLIPPAALAFVTSVFARRTLGGLSVAVGAIVALLAIAGETYLCIRWLGRVFDRTEPGR
ncbi:MAG: hypothetical protein WKG32_05235, partial [Gemmatimonadaceae bacterium]